MYLTTYPSVLRFLKKILHGKRAEVKHFFIFPKFFLGVKKKKKKILFLIAAENCITRCRWCELYSADETDRGLCHVVSSLFLY